MKISTLSLSLTSKSLNTQHSLLESPTCECVKRSHDILPGLYRILNRILSKNSLAKISWCCFSRFLIHRSSIIDIC